jgi:CBS domain-containing protein
MAWSGSFSGYGSGGFGTYDQDVMLRDTWPFVCFLSHPSPWHAVCCCTDSPRITEHDEKPTLELCGQAVFLNLVASRGALFQGAVMGKQLTAGDICKRKVTVGYKQTSLVAAAQLMREDHVGSLVVVDDENGSRQVRGLITDRDIVMSVVATGLDPEPLRLEDIMTERVVTANEADSLLDLMRNMREHGVRRVPVVGVQDELMGIVTMDDVLKILAQEMNTLVGSIDTGIKQERVRRR